jgi:ABC-2 type transport system ATP-binding protein
MFVEVPMIEAIKVSKRYKSVDFLSVDQQSLQIFKGEKFGIFGPNGAGKTTLIEMLSGITSPSSGEIVYHLSNAALPVQEVLHTIGLVPQEYAFFSELSPIQNCHYFGTLYGLSAAKLKERTEELMEVLGLEQVASKPVVHFSGGMKRRVNLALGILHEPQVLFLDEPTVGVDVQSKMAIMNYLEQLHQFGITIIYTSHHLKEAEAFCDRMALMDHGQIIAMDRLDRLIARHEGENLESFFIKLTGTDYRDS